MPVASPVFLNSPRYVLGEIEADHASIVNLEARAREFRMPPTAELWGWGRIHRTERSLEALAIDSARATLVSAGVEPSSVDALVVCSTRFPDGVADAHGRFVAAIATALELDDPAYFGLTLNRCTNLLAAVQLAEALVASGRHRTVLVITADRIHDEATRMENFALFSDGAASCLVTNDHGDGYEIVSSAAAHDMRELGSVEISADLSRRVNERLLAPLRMALADIAGLMHLNLFKPLVVMKERQAGFVPEQIYTDNIPRVGHCFAADPLINLVDRAALGQVQRDRYYMLASSAPGARIGVLLRRMEFS